MARTQTVQQLWDKVLRRANVERNTAKFTTTMGLDFIDSANAEFRDFIVQYDPDAFLTTDTITTVADTDTYALPSDFLHLTRVDVLENANKFRPVMRFNEAERNNYISGVFDAFRYKREGSNIVFVPTPSAGETIRVQYIPTATQLSSLSTTIDGINGWDELVVLYALRRVKVVQGISVTAVEMEIAKQENRVLNACAIRDSWQPDTLREADDYYWRVF